MKPFWLGLAIGLASGASVTFFVATAIYNRQYLRARSAGLTLLAEAARHKGGKISPHVAGWAARQLGVR